MQPIELGRSPYTGLSLMENTVNYIFVDEAQTKVLGGLDVDRFGETAPAEVALKHRDEQFPGAKAFVQVHENV